MSANNTRRANGTMEFACLENTPVWWETSQSRANRVPAGASLEVWRKAAGMDWEIEETPVLYGDPVKSLATHKVLTRNDNGYPLSVVGAQFQTTQPAQVLEFFRDLIEGAGYRLNTAGTLLKGTRFWAQAEIAEDVVTPGLANKAHLLFATGCDGSLANTIAAVNVEVVCSNTLAMAMAEGGGVKVTHRSVFNADDVKRRMGLTLTQYQKFIRTARELAKREISPVEANAFAFALFGGKADMKAEAEAKVRDSRGMRAVLALFGGEGIASDVEGRKGTAWGLVNAATEWVDHHQSAHSPDNKFNSAQFGAGAALKSNAWDKAVALLS